MVVSKVGKMASLLKLGRTIFPMVERNAFLRMSNLSRNMAYWNKDWKPGPFPKTEKERIAAAKKYGLRPEDYRPYPDDGMGFGDYPMLPRVSSESKNMYDGWDMPQYKRNFGEPLHVDADAMVEDRWSPDIRMRFSFKQMLLWLGVVWGSIAAVYILTLPYPHFQPVMPKQFAKDGVKHYTFEPCD